MATLSNSNLIINTIYSFFHEVQTVENIQDPISSYYYRFDHLNARLFSMNDNPTEEDIHIKKIWHQFYDSVRSKNTPESAERRDASLQKLRSYFPVISGLGIFSDTDLLVCADEYAADLPPNGISKKGVANLLQLYAEFTSHLKIQGSEAFREGVFRDIRTILSRSVGRELIEKILLNMPESHESIQIQESNECLFVIQEKEKRINHTLEVQPILQILPNGEWMTLKSPSFISLAHELLHLLHCFQGSLVHIDRERPDLTLHELDTNREERRTIHGDCGTEYLDRCHETTHISENGLRSQFLGLLPRKMHHAGIISETCKKSNFIFAACYGVHGNIRYFIRNTSIENLPIKTIFDTLDLLSDTEPTPAFPNPRESIAVILEEIRNRFNFLS